MLLERGCCKIQCIADLRLCEHGVKLLKGIGKQHALVSGCCFLGGGNLT